MTQPGHDYKIDVLDRKVDYNVDYLDRRFDGLERRMGDGFKRVDSHFRQVDERFIQVGDRVEAIDRNQTEGLNRLLVGLVACALVSVVALLAKHP